MPDAPTFANLLTQWSTGGPSVRRAVYAHLGANPDEAAAVEAFFRDDLRSPFPWRRVIAAEALVEVYGDEPAAAAALAWVLRSGAAAPIGDALEVSRKLSPDHCAPLLADFAMHAPDEFAAQPLDFHRWAGATLARAPERWVTVIDHAGASAEVPLLMGLADAALGAPGDLTVLAPCLKSRLFRDGSGYAAGAALWRVTWRVNRDWLASINSHSPQFRHAPELLGLLVEVLSEHLGRRSDLALLVRDLLVRLATDARELFAPAVARLTRLGGRGWAVLLPLLDDSTVPALARQAVLAAVVVRPAIMRLAHHRAHRVLCERGSDGEPAPLQLLGGAVQVLAAAGPGAGAAVPDLLELIVRQPATVADVLPALVAVAPGHPNPAAAVARTLDRLRRSVPFAPAAFTALAGMYAGFNFDGAPELIDDASLSVWALESLLREEPWAGAPPETRRRHAGAIAGRLGAPRAEARASSSPAAHSCRRSV